VPFVVDSGRHECADKLTLAWGQQQRVVKKAGRNSLDRQCATAPVVGTQVEPLAGVGLMRGFIANYSGLEEIRVLGS
jgi:hypothetical protein